MWFTNWSLPDGYVRCVVPDYRYNPALTPIMSLIMKPAVLNIDLIGTGSGVITIANYSSAGKDILCQTDCEKKISKGQYVGVEAVPDYGSVFVEWTGCDYDDGNGFCSVTVNGDRTIVANFHALPQNSLNVILAGNGSGSVTSAPNGISCGSDCT